MTYPFALLAAYIVGLVVLVGGSTDGHAGATLPFGALLAIAALVLLVADQRAATARRAVARRIFA